MELMRALASNRRPQGGAMVRGALSSGSSGDTAWTYVYPNLQILRPAHEKEVMFIGFEFNATRMIIPATGRGRGQSRAEQEQLKHLLLGTTPTVHASGAPLASDVAPSATMAGPSAKEVAAPESAPVDECLPSSFLEPLRHAATLGTPVAAGVPTHSDEDVPGPPAAVASLCTDEPGDASEFKKIQVAAHANFHEKMKFFDGATFDLSADAPDESDLLAPRTPPTPTLCAGAETSDIDSTFMQAHIAEFKQAGKAAAMRARSPRGNFRDQ